MSKKDLPNLLRDIDSGSCPLLYPEQQEILRKSAAYIETLKRELMRPK